MYKQVKSYVTTRAHKYLVIDHLEGEGDYRQLMNGKRLKGYEVVQGRDLMYRNKLAGKGRE
jgi:hypothetical protein